MSKTTKDVMEDIATELHEQATDFLPSVEDSENSVFFPDLDMMEEMTKPIPFTTCKIISRSKTK